MKASKEISAEVHVKVCCIQNGDCLFLLMGECKTTCALLSLGCLWRIFTRTLSIYVRGAAPSVLRSPRFASG